MYRTALAALVIAFLPVDSATAQSRKESVAFYWYVIPGTRKCELFASGHKIGLWDADEGKYYRVHDSGKLTGPYPPPWGNRTSASPEEKADTKEKVEPTAGEKKPPAEARPWYEELPPWAGYALGGVLTLLITCIGLAMQFRTNKAHHDG